RRPGVWRGVLHEATDQAGMFEPVVKKIFKVGSAEELGPMVAAAAAEALAPPRRPVYVEVPTDLLGAEVGEAEPPALAEAAPPAAPDDEHLAQAVELLDRAKRPLI